MSSEYHPPSPLRRSWRWAIVGLLALSACKQELYTNLSQRDANEMTAILLQNDVAAVRSSDAPDLFSISVDRERFAEAVEILKERGYPRQDFATLGEIFSGEGLISSPMEERARFIYALSQELSRTISEIDGVHSARVHIVLPKNDPMRTELSPSSASVFIRHDERTRVQALLPQIKMLVANSIEGLVYEKVSVTFFPSSNWSRVPSPASQEPGLDLPTLPMDRKTLILMLVLVLAAVLCGNAVFLWRWLRRRGEARQT